MLFAPLTWENGSVYLIDLHGNIVHTWNMPYPPGLSGYLTERGTLFYSGRTSGDSFLGRSIQRWRGIGSRLERQRCSGKCAIRITITMASCRATETCC